MGACDSIDYVFKMPESIDVSPSKWHNAEKSQGWNNTGTSEEPKLTLYQYLSFPPTAFHLLPQNGSETFYDGSFELDLTDLRNGAPQYIKDGNDSIRLYMTEGSIWVLGYKDESDAYHDFVYKLSFAQNISSAGCLKK